MRDSPAHVEAPGRHPQGRHSATVGDRRSGPVRGQPGAPAPPPARYRRAASTTSSRGPAGRTPTPTGRRRPYGPGSPPSARQLTADGLDAGPATIGWHLGREGLPVPSTSTIRRVLHAAGLVCPSRASARAAPGGGSRPRPPNEVWGSDFTHWRLVDGSEIEICSWLDDHSRYLLGCSAFRRVGGDDVVATFSAAGDGHGWPAATLTDNGSVYTSRFTGGRNNFEYLLAYLGIRQKNGMPGHPQTQGKIERFQQTLKRWLGRQPAAPEDLDGPRGATRHLQADHATTSSGPTGRSAGQRPASVPVDGQGPPAGLRRPGHFRLRSDVTDSKGAMTLRGRAGCTTSRSAPPMPAGGSSRSSTSRRSRSSPSTPARSSRATGSSLIAGTGATNDETPADGRGLSETG